MPDHCFTYGSLMCDDIMSAVCGAPVAGEPARLDGYRRHPVAGEDYPGMLPAAQAAVEGMLYLDLPAAAWPRLDAFEGDEYQRTEVEVRLADGRRLAAWAYVFKPALAARLEDGEWNFAHFLAHGRARFMARYCGFAQGEAPQGDSAAECQKW